MFGHSQINRLRAHAVDASSRRLTVPSSVKRFESFSPPVTSRRRFSARWPVTIIFLFGCLILVFHCFLALPSHTSPLDREEDVKLFSNHRENQTAAHDDIVWTDEECAGQLHRYRLLLTASQSDEGHQALWNQILRHCTHLTATMVNATAHNNNSVVHPEAAAALSERLRLPERLARPHREQKTRETTTTTPASQRARRHGLGVLTEHKARDSQLMEEVQAALQDELESGAVPFYSTVWQLDPKTHDVAWTPYIEKRRAVHRVFRTQYGCDTDPIVLAVTAKNILYGHDGEPLLEKLRRVASLKTLNSPFPGGYERPEAIPPYKLGLLFLITKPLAHPDVWVEWLREATAWSRRLYDERQGPYAEADDASFQPLYVLKVHLSTPAAEPQTFYSNIVDVWRQWGGTSAETTPNPMNQTLETLPSEFKESLIPERQCEWGNLNPCEHGLLAHAMSDPHVFGFIFISETSVPVKPFSFIYEEFQKNPRSRFFLSNFNLPETPKHHQWIVLNRPHAYLLVQNPEKWVCDVWMRHWYTSWQAFPDVAAPDEYLPFYALKDLLGSKRLLSEINDGNPNVLQMRDKAQHLPGSRNSRHTWVCWHWRLCGETIESESCDAIGKGRKPLSSPVTYYVVRAKTFEKTVIRNKQVWFARKFAPECIVDLTNEADGFRDKAQDFLSSLSVPFVSHDFFLPTSKIVTAKPTERPQVLSFTTWLNQILSPSFFETLQLHEYPETLMAV